MQTFVLIRHEDPTGVSGTGVVAEGVEFTDGTTVLRWLYRPGSDIEPTTVVHGSAWNVSRLHGHDGHTEIQWLAPGERRDP